MKITKAAPQKQALSSTLSKPPLSSKHKSSLHSLLQTPKYAIRAALKRKQMQSSAKALPFQKSLKDESPKVSTRDLKKSPQKVIHRRNLSDTNASKYLSQTKLSNPTSTSRPISSQHQRDVVPVTPATVLRNLTNQLTSYQQGEILNFKEVYFIGTRSNKLSPNISGDLNFGYDNVDGDYTVVRGDQIAYRYEIVDLLGSGSFGKVVKAFDHKHKRDVALKVIRNASRFHRQAAVQIRVLKQLLKRGADHVVHIQDFFVFRQHVCITFELLHISLYEYMRKNGFRGLPLKTIRGFAAQILQALKIGQELMVIHCDLKPDNIMLRRSGCQDIKVIDYGSACLENEQIYTYIQSRFYRAPEIMLGIEYSHKIDVWSFGCILAELFTGKPLFPGECEAEQLSCIMEVIGLPHEDMMNRATRSKLFFREGRPILYTNARGVRRHPGVLPLETVLRGADPEFVAVVAACLQWRPEDRPCAADLLSHSWILQNSQKRRHLRTNSLQPHQNLHRASHVSNPSLGADELESLLNNPQASKE